MNRMPRDVPGIEYHLVTRGAKTMDPFGTAHSRPCS